MDIQERDWIQQHLVAIEKYQDEQLKKLASINSSLIFIGIVVLLSVIAAVCAALGIHV